MDWIALDNFHYGKCEGKKGEWYLGDGIELLLSLGLIAEKKKEETIPKPMAQPQAKTSKAAAKSKG